MDKRSCLLNNLSSGSIRIIELNLTLPPGVSDLFELNPELSYEQIDYSLRNGTLRASMDNGLCHIVPANFQKSYSSDVVVKKPGPVQVFPSRIKFAVAVEADTVVFDQDE